MMNSTNTKSLFFILLSLGSFLLSSASFGRAPAVEPVTGISIDQYREVDPKEDKGFDWHQDSSKFTRFKNNRTTGQRASVAYDSSASTTMSVVFLVAIVAFPIALWFTLMKSFPNTPSSSPENSGHQSVTIDLATERSKREEKEGEEDDHIHKAS